MNQRIKRTIAMLSAALCLFGTVACGADDSDGGNNGGGSNNNNNNNNGSVVLPEEGEDLGGSSVPPVVEVYKTPYTITVAQDKSGDFDTLEKALAKVKELQADANIIASHDAISIEMKAGRYRINEPIVIDGDTATGTLPIAINGATNGTTILDAGEQFSGGWTVHDKAKGIYRKTLSNVENFRQLYVNDKVAIRSRFPNDTGDLSNDYMKLYWDENYNRVGIPKYVYEDFGKNVLSKAELHFVQEWAQSIGHIDGNITTAGEAAYFGFDQPWFSKMLFKRPYPIRNSDTNRCWLENTYEFIDADNEWYFDDATKTLYYKPSKGVDIQTMTFSVPQEENILKFEGTEKKLVKDIKLSNLTLANTNWDYASEEGYMDGQAGIYFGPQSPAMDTKSTSSALFTRYTQDIMITNCHIKNTGAYGVDFYIGTKNATLVDSIVEKTGGSGITIGSYGEKVPEDRDYFVSNSAASPTTKKEITEHITVYNCLVREIGTAFKSGSTGIVAGFARNLDIAQNTITNVAYSGIAVGWGWENYNNVLCNIKINRNHITNVMNHLPFDGGGIYLLGRHVVTPEASEIKGNYVEIHYDGTFGGLGGIYFDCASSAYRAENNVVKGEGKCGIVDVHDYNYLLMDLSVKYTYTNLQFPDKDVYHHNYWSSEDYPGFVDPAPTPASRGVEFDKAIFAYQNGQWSAEAQTIINNAGKK